MSKFVQPTVKETAFSCPFCFAFTTQHWYDVYADSILGMPNVITSMPSKIPGPQGEQEDIEAFFESLVAGFVTLAGSEEEVRALHVMNLHLSKCYNCKKIAVWVHDRLLFPVAKSGVQPNQDLPPEIIHDFEEAREIVNASPRGAAALLRLCIQKLCAHLGESGKNIDQDIASLVRKGLNPRVQQSLDIVRVIGNEAVHPGELDLKDDRETATHLFALINSIADQMISHPKTIDAMYAKLPEAKRKGIEQRDKSKP